jgi:hypothetical protein
VLTLIEVLLAVAGGAMRPSSKRRRVAPPARHSDGMNRSPGVHPPVMRRARRAAATIAAGPVRPRVGVEMGEAIGQSLPAAVGIALSPMPIIAVVLLLTTGAAGRNGAAFVAGWLAGLAVIGVVVLAFAGPAAHDRRGSPATWVGWLQLVIGVSLLLLAVRQFRRRPAAGAEPAMPHWMQRVERFNAVQSLGVGAALCALNVKNLLLAVAAAAAIAKTGIPGGRQALAYAVFMVIATLSVAAPVVIYLTMGDRSVRLLARLKHWMSHNNAVIISVLCLVIGAKLLGDAIAGLSG